MKSEVDARLDSSNPQIDRSPSATTFKAQITSLSPFSFLLLSFFFSFLPFVFCFFFLFSPLFFYACFFFHTFQTVSFVFFFISFVSVFLSNSFFIFLISFFLSFQLDWIWCRMTRGKKMKRSLQPETFEQTSDDAESLRDSWLKNWRTVASCYTGSLSNGTSSFFTLEIFYYFSHWQ